MDFYNVPFGLPQNTLFNVLAFKTVAQTNVQRWGGIGESRTFTLPFGSVDMAATVGLKNPVGSIFTNSLTIQIIVLFLFVYG